MKASRIATRAPMKKLFAVALVGTASTAMAVSWSASPAPVDEPVVEPEHELVIDPLVLRSGSPACGNVTHKGTSGSRACTTGERVVHVIVRSAVTNGR